MKFRRPQLMALVAISSCLLLPGCGGVNSVSDFYERYIVGTSRTIVNALDDTLRLDIDSGTFSKVVTLLFADVLSIPVATLLLISGADFKMEDPTVSIVKDILFTLDYNELTLPEGVNEGDLALYRIENDTAVKIENAVIDIENNKISADISTTGTYVIAKDDAIE